MDAVVSSDQTAAANVTDFSSTSIYPYDCVCSITVGFSNGQFFGGSGVLIGPHTILTASHVLWNADLNASATSVGVYLGNPGGPPILDRPIVHYFQVNDVGGRLTLDEMQNDYAIIDFPTNLSSYGSFGLQPDFSGGTVHLTGYPDSANGQQSDQVGVVAKDSDYSLLDYVSVTATPGSSGSPVWIDQGTPATPLPYAVGVVSTTGHAALLTAADVQVITGWERADALQFAATGATLHAQIGVTDVEGTPGPDIVIGWSNNDYLRGNDGNDSIVGGSGFDDVNGNKGDDTIDGGIAGGGDWLVGGQGNDLIAAHLGDGLLYGNLGDDTLSGGSGSEIIRGGQGADSLSGGPGNDFMSGDKGADTMTGGPGADIFHSSTGAGIDEVTDFSRAQGDYVLLDAGSTYSVSQSGTDTIVTLGAPGAGDQLILVGVSMSSLTDGWIVVAV